MRRVAWSRVLVSLRDFSELVAWCNAEGNGWKECEKHARVLEERNFKKKENKKVSIGFSTFTTHLITHGRTAARARTHYVD